MKLVKIPTKRPGKKLKLNFRKLRKIFLVAALVVIIAIGLYFAWPWLKSKGIVPVGDDERRDNLHASRNEQDYSAILLKNLEANEGEISKAEPAARYEHYAKKANELTMLERYLEAEQAFLEAEKTGAIQADLGLAEAHYVSFGMMYEAKGDHPAAHEQYEKALSAVQKLPSTNDMKSIKLEEINELLERTKG